MVELNNENFEELMCNKRVNFQTGKKSNVLIIGDLHEPFSLKDYPEFCYEQGKRFKCNKVVLIGDEVDNHATSYHESDPNGVSAGTEFNMAYKKLQILYKMFPKVIVTIGNHTALPDRKAKSAGISRAFIRSYKEAWKAPIGWNWQDEVEIDDVLYFHGTGKSGAGMAKAYALLKMQSVVVGHAHSQLKVEYIASHKKLVFGMNVGCGINDRLYAFEYAKGGAKSVIGCGVVLGGKEAIPIPMPL